MGRKIKAMATALGAMAALGAIGASGAAAEGTLRAVIGNEGQTTITAEQTEQHVLTTAGRNITCNTAIFEGTVVNGAHEVFVTPTYEDCSASGLPMTVTHNGCEYRLYGGEGTSEHHFIGGTVDIVNCDDPEIGIEVHLYSSANNHAQGQSLCTITVPEQQGLTDNTLVNNTPSEGVKDVELTTDLHNLQAIVHGSNLVCGPDEQVFTYTGESTVRAYSDEAHENQVDLTVEEVL